MRTLKNLIAIAGISLITTAPLIYGGGYLATGVSNPLELRQIYKQRQEEGRKLYLVRAGQSFRQHIGCRKPDYAVTVGEVQVDDAHRGGS